MNAKPLVRSLFRADQVYEIIGEVIVGDPIVIIPENYRELTRPLLDKGPPIQQLYLMGAQCYYEDTHVFDAEEIVQVKSGAMPENALGVIQAVRLDGISPRDAATNPPAKPGQAIVVVPLNSEPVAFVLSPERQLRRAGMMVYSATKQAQLGSEQLPELVEITWDDVIGQDKATVKLFDVEPVVPAQSPQQILFPQPVPCPYCGHASKHLVLCSSCGVPVCNTCREEARGCITVGCSNSACH